MVDKQLEEQQQVEDNNFELEEDNNFELEDRNFQIMDLDMNMIRIVVNTFY
jgi:hypothetical protein